MESRRAKYMAVVAWALFAFSLCRLAALGGAFDSIPRPGIILELGRILRGSKYVRVDLEDHFNIDDQTRFRSGYVTVNVVKANVTLIKYRRLLKMPFTSRGCMPVFFYANNPAVIDDEDLQLGQPEPWRIVLFANPVTSIPLELGDHIIFGTFTGKDLPPDLEEKILDSGNMIISNLVFHDDLNCFRKSTLFSGYLLAFDLLTRVSVDMPVLANLVITDRGHCLGGYVEGLSHSFSGHNLPLHPALPQAKMISSEEIGFPEHYTTHIDAPAHLREDAFTIDRLPTDQLYPCIKVNKVATSAGAEGVGIESFEQWEKENGKIRSDSLVFVDTGLGKTWPTYDTFFKVDPKTGDIQFEGVTGEAAQWLVKNRTVYGIGIDTSSLDSKSALASLPTHIALGRNSLVGFENVANLDKLPNRASHPSMNPVSWCLVVYLRIEGGTASPAAIFALTVPNNSQSYGFSTDRMPTCESSSSHKITFSPASLLIAVVTSTVFYR